MHLNYQTRACTPDGSFLAVPGRLIGMLSATLNSIDPWFLTGGAMLHLSISDSLSGRMSAHMVVTAGPRLDDLEAGAVASLVGPASAKAQLKRAGLNTRYVAVRRCLAWEVTTRVRELMVRSPAQSSTPQQTRRSSRPEASVQEDRD